MTTVRKKASENAEIDKSGEIDETGENDKNDKNGDKDKNLETNLVQVSCISYPIIF